MESNDRRLSMSRISAPFPPNGAIRKSASTQHSTPVKDQVSAKIHLAIKLQPITIPAFLMTVGSSRAGKKSTTMIKAGLTTPYKDKKPIFIKYHLQKSSLVAINFPN
jgi:hypothetical protein